MIPTDREVLIGKTGTTMWRARRGSGTATTGYGSER